jgi:4a-hydroxytetrahydrobiopterin dehydratase
MTDELLSGDQVEAMGVDDWRSMYGAIEAWFDTGDFATGLRLVDAIGAAAEEAGHHPDVTLTYGAVHVLLTSHDVGGKTRRDVDLARRISEIAADLSVRATPEKVQRLELALDTWDVPAMQRFWSAVQGVEPDPTSDEVRDPTGVNPTIWFQETDEHDEPRQRFHLDLRVPPDQVEARLAAAMEAGGTLVSDAEAPRFWVVADPQGNKICLCTHRTRQH